MSGRDGEALLLSGLDGGNPLGFLAAVGTASIAGEAYPDSRFMWKDTSAGWRPLFLGCGSNDWEFCEKVSSCLKKIPPVFNIDKKFPFSIDKLRQELGEHQRQSSLLKRRDADFLACFGSELYADAKKDEFKDTSFRMVRRGDSAGQGMMFYAKTNCENTDRNHVERALFRIWDYQDDGYSLRWDPSEDQRYALRWKDPSAKGGKLADGRGIMLAAYGLAIEALRCFPTMPVGRRTQTTGFMTNRKTTSFVWPIWTQPVTIDTIRSLLASPDIHEIPVSRSSLSAKGIAEVFLSQRIHQNQYYHNFAPAQSLA